jgi:flavin-dependent thymidylate synthase
MRVVLAGYNVDRDVLDELKKKSPERLDVTPETLSASYARISRDPRPADELRRSARAEVEKARRSNQTIIFKMGHHSVAEHAVFNFDLIGLSRLAIEAVERFRLCSFTEKSQRYITLGDDFVVPEEIVSAGRRDLFVAAVRSQNAFYHKLYGKLKPHVFGRHPGLAALSKNHMLLDGWAKEDARYAVSLATEGQLGLTVNARNLELMIRRFAAHSLAEVRELGRRLYELARDVAPSIILFAEATDFDARTYSDFAAASAEIEGGPAEGAGPPAPAKARRLGDAEVRLVDRTEDGDVRILAALRHSVSGETYPECLSVIRALGRGGRASLVKKAFEYMEFYDVPLREFEYADLTFELAVSASCFAQLKRHRMATLTAQDYDPALGVTVPPSIVDVGLKKEFKAIVDETNAVHAGLQKEIGPAADYLLTNAHRRRCLLKVNVRELYHVARLREDPTAQWDIRRISGKMSALARRVMPLACLLLGSKESYGCLYEKAFGRPPKLSPPALLK